MRACMCVCVVSVVLCLSVYDWLLVVDPNGCAMTWMFEFPQYVPVPLNESVGAFYPRYGLSFYCEGAGCSSYRPGRMRGVPVLFIPGNADSHKQVRSLGSVSYRKGLDAGVSAPVHLFSVSLNEEWSALFGPVLQEQAAFLRHCIEHIRHLYQPVAPQVVLLGNSMGGVVARALFSPQLGPPPAVSLLITQASPLSRPVLRVDAATDRFYESAMSSLPSDVVLVSLSGGVRDTLVSTPLTEPVGSIRSTWASTTSVPRVWLSTDHRCIVWCKELVLVTSRLLMELNTDLLSAPSPASVQRIFAATQRYYVGEKGPVVAGASATESTSLPEGAVSPGVYHTDGDGEWLLLTSSPIRCHSPRPHECPLQQSATPAGQLLLVPSTPVVLQLTGPAWSERRVPVVLDVGWLGWAADASVPSGRLHRVTLPAASPWIAWQVQLDGCGEVQVELSGSRGMHVFRHGPSLVLRPLVASSALSELRVISNSSWSGSARARVAVWPTLGQVARHGMAYLPALLLAAAVWRRALFVQPSCPSSRVRLAMALLAVPVGLSSCAAIGWLCLLVERTDALPLVAMGGPSLFFWLRLLPVQGPLPLWLATGDPLLPSLLGAVLVVAARRAWGCAPLPRAVALLPVLATLWAWDALYRYQHLMLAIWIAEVACALGRGKDKHE